MGRNYLSAGNFRKTTKEPISFELNIGQIGELRVIESKIKSCELYRDFEGSKKESTIDILEEILVVSGSIEVRLPNVAYKVKKDQILEATVVLEIPTVKLKYTIDGKISLA